MKCVLLNTILPAESDLTACYTDFSRFYLYYSSSPPIRPDFKPDNPSVQRWRLQDYAYSPRSCWMDQCSFVRRFQISDGEAGIAAQLAQAEFVDIFAGCDLSIVSAASIANLKTMRNVRFSSLTVGILHEEAWLMIRRQRMRRQSFSTQPLMQPPIRSKRTL